MTRSNMSRGLALVVGLAVMVAFVSLTVVQPVQADSHKITFAATAGTVGWIMDIAKRKKYDEKNGIDLDVKRFSPGPGMQAVIMKKVDAGLMSVIGGARANARKHRVRFLAPLLTAHWGIVVGSDTKYRSFDELKGKRIGSLPRVTSIYNILALVMKMKGVDLEKRYKMVFGAPPVLQGLLIKKDIDAVVHFDQSTVRRIAAGQFRELVNLGAMWNELTGGQYLMAVGVSAQEDWIKADPARARKLGRTIADSLAFIKSNTTEAIGMGGKMLGLKTERAKQLAIKRLPLLIPGTWNAKTLADTKMSLQKSVEFGLLAKEAGQFTDALFAYMPAEIKID